MLFLMNDVAVIFLCIIGLPLILGLVLLPFIIRTAKMTANFNKLREGMSFSEVMSIMGSPNKTNQVDNVTICTWRRTPISGLFVIRNAYFKDDILISTSTDKTYS